MVMLETEKVLMLSKSQLMHTEVNGTGEATSICIWTSGLGAFRCLSGLDLPRSCLVRFPSRPLINGQTIVRLLLLLVLLGSQGHRYHVWLP